MFKPKDSNSFTKSYDLSDSNGIIGRLTGEFQVTHIDDIQLNDFSSVKKSASRSYLIHCSQKIIISGTNQNCINPTKRMSEYTDYPALLLTSLSISSPSASLRDNLRLLDYSPKTVNTQLETSGTSGNSTDSSASRSSSKTTGSSTSETNSFGCTVSLDGGSANYEHSSTTTHDQSATTGTEDRQSHGTNASESTSMSIKDWGAYGYVDTTKLNPVWLFGQEYPWNTIICRKTDAPNGDGKGYCQLQIPPDMKTYLHDGDFLFPPSQLSLFGVNFSMKAVWLVTLDNSSADTVDINYDILLSRASHSLDGSDVKVSLQRQATSISPNTPETINLPLMSIEAIGNINKQAILGFIQSKFIVPPAPVTNGKATNFKIISSSNNLYVLDTKSYPADSDNGVGFSVAQSCLTARFSQKCPSLQITTYFKVIDTSHDYNLYIKHWLGLGSPDIKLTLIFNQDTTNPLVKYVVAEESAGAEKNLLTIALRDLNYASTDFHDYLQMGLNSIEINIEPVSLDNIENCCYQIKALSIEPN